MTKTILLVFGGESSEHEVSLMSAHNVAAALDTTKYTVRYCYIDRAGRWWLVSSVSDAEVGQTELLPVLGARQFVTYPQGERIDIDVLFPVLHGDFGEDGTVQGMAELLHLPCVGPGLVGAALTYDKLWTKRIIESLDGITIVPWVVWRTYESKPSYRELAEILGTTLFVKPSRAGSSVGVSRVDTEDQWNEALDTAAQYGDGVLIESAIDAREIEVAVLGNHEIEVSVPGEIIPGEVFYSYDDKYSEQSESHAVIPADLDTTVFEEIRRQARVAYQAHDCRGMARVDFFIDKHTGVIYLNEINAIPGFTDISMYSKLWQASGLNYTELIDRLIALACE